MAELLAFDYEQTFVLQDDIYLARPGIGDRITVREFLDDRFEDPWFFPRLELLKGLGSPENLRFVFWFDN